MPNETLNPFPIIQRTIEAHLNYESRCEAEREGAPRFCGACQYYHEEVDGECPYMEGLQGPML